MALGWVMNHMESLGKSKERETEREREREREREGGRRRGRERERGGGGERALVVEQIVLVGKVKHKITQAVCRSAHCDHVC
jgi:hypothetical protein